MTDRIQLDRIGQNTNWTRLAIINKDRNLAYGPPFILRRIFKILNFLFNNAFIQNYYQTNKAFLMELS